MAIGPVQLVVIGFVEPNFQGEVIAELERLRQSDTVRVIDALAVYKDAEGELEVEHLSNLTEEEAIELGSKVGALIGLGIEGEDGAEVGAAVGADAAEDGIAGGREIERAQVARLEGAVEGRLVGRARNRLGRHDRRRRVPVVEQRRVGGEALLTHQLLGVQAAVGPAELGVTLRRYLTGAAVVGHRRCRLSVARVR